MAKFKPFLKVSFDVPKDLEQTLRALEDKIRKHVIRQALRSAVVPLRIGLQAELASLDTPQTSGASLRAVDARVGQSKSNPNRFYGIVGVRRNYFEIVFSQEKSRLAPLQNRPGIRQISMGVIYRDRYGRMRETKRPGRREVQSKLKVRSGPKGRRPSRYWHLLLYGFGPDFKRGTKAGQKRSPFAGHRLLEKVRDTKRQEARQIFIERFRQLMSQAVR